MSEDAKTNEPEQTSDDAPKVVATKVTSLDDAPEALRPFYKKVEGDGGSAYYLQTDRVEPAVNALEGLKKRTDERIQQRDDTIADLTKRIEAMESAAPKSKDGGKDANPNELDSLRERVKALAEENEALSGKVKTYEDAKAKAQHRARLRSDFENSGVALDPDALELAVDLAEKRTKPSRNDAGEITGLAYLDRDGKELFGEMSEPATAADWLKRQTEKNRKTHWLKKGPSGSDSHQSRNGNTVHKPVEEWTDEERVAFIKKPGGRERYQKLLNDSARDELDRRREASEPRRKAS